MENEYEKLKLGQYTALHNVTSVDHSIRAVNLPSSAQVHMLQKQLPC